MNDNQKTAFGNDFGLIYYPYDFEDAIANHCSYSYSEEQLKSLSEMGKFWKFIENHRSIWDKSTDSITIEQETLDEKGTMTFVGLGVEYIIINTEKKSKRIDLVKSIFKGTFVGNIDIDFYKPLKNIVFHFLYDMAEPYELEVNLVKYKEPEINYQTQYLENMNIDHAVGENLVNIYFNKAKPDIDQVEIDIYKVVDEKNSRLISKEKFDSNILYYSKNNLAYGRYEFKVTQYANGEKIVESPNIGFGLSRPRYPQGKNTVNLGGR
jgi:hypothetical protein